MYFAAHADGSYSPLELSGTAGSTEIKSLQASLHRLAQAVRRPAAFPGPTNGVIGERTMISIASLFDKMGPYLPPWVHQPMNSALMQGVSSSDAKNTVGRYVTELRYAADQAIGSFQNSYPPMPSFRMTPLNGLRNTDFFAPGWYQQPSRLAIIGGILLLGFWIWSHHHAKQKRSR